MDISAAAGWSTMLKKDQSKDDSAKVEHDDEGNMTKAVQMPS